MFLFYLVLLSFFNKGFFSFWGTSFLYVQFSFLCLQGIYTATELWVKGRGQETKLHLEAQKKWQVFKMVWECLACVDHRFTAFSSFTSTAEVWRISDSPSYPFCRCCCLESYKGYNKPLLVRLTFTCLCKLWALFRSEMSVMSYSHGDIPCTTAILNTGLWFCSQDTVLTGAINRNMVFLQVGFSPNCTISQRI